MGGNTYKRSITSSFPSSVESAMNTVTLSKVVLKKRPRILEETKKKDDNILKEGKRHLIFLLTQTMVPIQKKTKENSPNAKGMTTNISVSSYRRRQNSINIYPS